MRRYIFTENEVEAILGYLNDHSKNKRKSEYLRGIVGRAKKNWRKLEDHIALLRKLIYEYDVEVNG